jgi:hypothetical protein
LTVSPVERTLSNMDLTERDALWSELGDALDECYLTPKLRDRVDKAVAEVVRAERADVLSCLVIAVDDGESGLQAVTPRPLA